MIKSGFNVKKKLNKDLREQMESWCCKRYLIFKGFVLW